MRVLITGAAGFIGSHLSERLVGDGHDVVGLDNFDPYYDVAVKKANIESLLTQDSYQFVEGDIRDGAALDRLATACREEGRPIDGLVHLAARAGVRASLEDPSTYVDVNLAGTMAVLECARRHDIRRFVFASSSSVYGARSGDAFREDDCTDFPVSPYAATKKAGEALCYTHHHLYGLAVTCLRFFTVYGPRQRPEMAIHLFTRAIAEGEPLGVFGDGSAERDFTYIDDIVQGIVAALERTSGYRIYNLGNNRTVTVIEVIRLLERALGKAANIDFQGKQPGDVPLTRANIDLAKAELGYNPCTSIEAGVATFVEWFASSGRETVG